MKKNKEMIREAIDKQEQILNKEMITRWVINELIEDEQLISSAQQIVTLVAIESIVVTKKFVIDQMNMLGLKYKKIKHISWQGNSDKSLVLRQRWAMQFLELDHKAINVINIDETWVNMTDFRRFHWKPKSNYSVKAKAMAPRVSMITGVDKLANIYLCLTQSNSNKSMMSLFMEHLVNKLDKQNPYWRNSTII